ncbi:hypothetical protein WA158_002118 [Blastocystis sp. Blastoise]
MDQTERIQPTNTLSGSKFSSDDLDSNYKLDPFPSRFMTRIGGITHPGSHDKVNDDRYFLLEGDSSEGHYVAMGIFDGHFPDTGSLAASIACNTMQNVIKQKDFMHRLVRDTEKTFNALFKEAHLEIWKAFITYYQTNHITTGVKKRDDKGMFLVKREKEEDSWECICGGTTASVVIILDGYKILTANVGDSHSYLGGFQTPRHSADYFSKKSQPQKNIPLIYNIPLIESLLEFHEYVHLTTSHSPDNIKEYQRITNTFPANKEKTKPEILFLYDSLSSNKEDCPPLYAISEKGELYRTNKGLYQKNIRNEWASFVMCPPTDPYYDALALTRSLGDFHLQTYGITYKPSISCIDLREAYTVKGDYSSVANQTPQSMIANEGIISPIDKKSLSPVGKKNCKCPTRISPSSDEEIDFKRSYSKSYCVTCNPDDDSICRTFSGNTIHDSININPHYSLDAFSNSSKNSTQLTAVNNSFSGVIVLGSDGFWDNWNASSVFELLLADKQIEKARSLTHVDYHASLLLADTLFVGNETFGQSIDNITLLLCYLLPK